MNRFEKLPRHRPTTARPVCPGRRGPAVSTMRPCNCSRRGSKSAQERIECSLVLDQMCRLLHELMVDEPISPHAVARRAGCCAPPSARIARTETPRTLELKPAESPAVSDPARSEGDASESSDS